MFGKLKGTIDSIYNDHLILDVNGVGYLIFCSQKTLTTLTISPSQVVEMWIETHVREDHIHLYGFVNLAEKSAFNMLQSVKGVGVRMALSILSHMDPAAIQTALYKQSKESFNQISGIGKKLSERIIIELKDKVIFMPQNYHSSATTQLEEVNAAKQLLTTDAIMVLVNLGINKIEAQNRVSYILSQHDDIAMNDLIRLALKN